MYTSCLCLPYEMDMYEGNLDCEYGGELELYLFCVMLWMPRGVLSSVCSFVSLYLGEVKPKLLFRE